MRLCIGLVRVEKRQSWGSRIWESHVAVSAPSSWTVLWVSFSVDCKGDLMACFPPNLIAAYSVVGAVEGIVVFIVL